MASADLGTGEIWVIFNKPTSIEAAINKHKFRVVGTSDAVN